jgi:predicted component of viral defense system (DUF524 family)
MSGLTSNALITNLNELVTNCSSLSEEYQKKHGELLEVASGFQKAVDIIKKQMKDYKVLITNLFSIINEAQILNNNDLEKMRTVQDQTMENFRLLQKTLDEYISDGQSNSLVTNSNDNNFQADNNFQDDNNSPNFDQNIVEPPSNLVTNERVSDDNSIVQQEGNNILDINKLNQLAQNLKSNLNTTFQSGGKRKKKTKKKNISMY